jgi:hypothetical protein
LLSHHLLSFQRTLSSYITPSNTGKRQQTPPNTRGTLFFSLFLFFIKQLPLPPTELGQPDRNLLRDTARLSSRQSVHGHSEPLLIGFESLGAFDADKAADTFPTGEKKLGHVKIPINYLLTLPTLIDKRR